ncbi:MAG: glycosyltransferase family 2 protein [Pseudomonadota bacterium]
MTIVGVTCQRDDGPYLTEWIAHHLAAGFDRILVMSHECSDGSDALLESLSADERIGHLPFEPRGKKSVQWQALDLVRNHPWTERADWLLFFDCDEFICLPDGNLQGLLSEFEAEQGHFDALALPWRLFGSSGQRTRTPGLTPVRFTRAAPEDLHFPLAHLFKTLYRPGAFQKMGVHRPRSKSKKPATWLGPDGLPLPDYFAANDAFITLYGTPLRDRRIWLNHYSLRSIEEFIVKRARGLPNHTEREIGLTYWAERNWNSVETTDILHMMDATQIEFERLMSLPDVSMRQAQCNAWHEQRAVALMKDRETLHLHFRLGMLSGSTPPSPAAAQDFIEAQRQMPGSERRIR